jgi:hypothetical protein
MIKSNASMNKNGYVSLIISLEYQFPFPDCKSVKALSDGLLSDQYVISRSYDDLIKISTNVKEKVKIQTVYSIVKNENF